MGTKRTCEPYWSASGSALLSRANVRFYIWPHLPSGREQKSSGSKQTPPRPPQQFHPHPHRLCFCSASSVLLIMICVSSRFISFQFIILPISPIKMENSCAFRCCLLYFWHMCFYFKFGSRRCNFNRTALRFRFYSTSQLCTVSMFTGDFQIFISLASQRPVFPMIPDPKILSHLYISSNFLVCKEIPCLKRSPSRADKGKESRLVVANFIGNVWYMVAFYRVTIFRKPM